MKKRFMVEFIIEDDKKINIHSEGEGMSCVEVLGFLEWKRADIMKQVTGEIKPDKVVRTAIINDEATK